MRDLHVVAVSEDGRHVLLAGRRGATKGGFRVALDERLTAAVRGDLPRPGEDPHAAPELTPKEIQARLRAGESAESIALSAGVPVPRVERFSGPVQGEMARMIDAARTAYLVRGRLGRSAVPLGVAVDVALAATPSLRADSVDWQTRRDDEGRWLVTVTWFARARARSASWLYHPPTKTVTALDPASAALAHADPDSPAAAPRRRTAAAPVTRTPARKKPAAKKTPAKRAVAKKAPAKKAPAKRAVAKRAPAKKAPVKKAVATKAPVKKAVAKKAPVKKAVAKKAPAKKAPAKRVAAKKVAPPPGRAVRALRVVPDPEPPRTTPTGRTARPARTGRTAAERDGVASRASVPGWADVLLGTSARTTRDDR